MVHVVVMMVTAETKQMKIVECISLQSIRHGKSCRCVSPKHRDYVTEAGVNYFLYLRITQCETISKLIFGTLKISIKGLENIVIYIYNLDPY